MRAGRFIGPRRPPKHLHRHIVGHGEAARPLIPPGFLEDARAIRFAARDRSPCLPLAYPAQEQERKLSIIFG